MFFQEHPDPVSAPYAEPNLAAEIASGAVLPRASGASLSERTPAAMPNSGLPATAMQDTRVMQRLKTTIVEAQAQFARMLQAFLNSRVADRATYQRYLSMQYHLSKGIQRDFMMAAAHSDLNKRRTLRAFLVEFANERELHYLVAANDLHMLGLELLPEPLDATLWHAYFDRTVAERPFVRLGAAATVENIGGGAAQPLYKLALAAKFLNRDNTKFLALHEDEETACGDQVLAALDATNLREHHISDMVLGAKQGAVMYLRLMDWALNPDSLGAWPDNDRSVPAAAPAALQPGSGAGGGGTASGHVS